MRVTKPYVLLLLTVLGGAALGAISPSYQEDRRIYGKVTGENGSPLPNVHVILEYAPFGVIPEERWTEMSRTLTSESGEFRFSVRAGSVKKELPSGSYRLTFEYPGLGQVARITQIGRSLSGPEGTAELVQEINVQLRRSRSIGGGATSARQARARISPYPRGTPSPESSANVNPPENTGGSANANPPENTGGSANANVSANANASANANTSANANASSNTNAAANTNASSNTNSSANTNASVNTNASANANVGPDPAADPTSSEIDRILKGLALGNIAFNTPESMSLNEAKKVELLLSSSLSPENLKKEVEKQNVEGSIQVEEIQISDQMEATLTGDGFQITEVLPARRAISKTGVTEWKWDVRALKEGKLRLHLTLNALVTVSGNPPQQHTIRTFDKEYVVVVGVKDTVISFARQHWQWLWTTVLLPVGAWLWKRKRKEAAA